MLLFENSSKTKENTKDLWEDFKDKKIERLLSKINDLENTIEYLRDYIDFQKNFLNELEEEIIKKFLEKREIDKFKNYL